MDTLQSGLSRGAHLYHGVAHSPARGGEVSGGGAGGVRQEAPLVVLNPHHGGEGLRIRRGSVGLDSEEGRDYSI